MEIIVKMSPEEYRAGWPEYRRRRNNALAWLGGLVCFPIFAGIALMLFPAFSDFGFMPGMIPMAGWAFYGWR